MIKWEPSDKDCSLPTGIFHSSRSDRFDILSRLKNTLFLLFLVGFSYPSVHAETRDSSARRWPKTLAWSLDAAGIVGTHAILYKVWYSDFDQTPFHWKNDQKEWLDMDKAGHAWASAFITSKVAGGFRLAGYSRKKSAWIGIGSALVFQYAIEYFDGLSSGWGASVGDLEANTLGIIFAGAQQYFWGKTRIPFRFTFKPTSFSAMRPDVLGSNLPQNVLKDYNGQTYWFDFNPYRMQMRPAWWPRWLGFNVGYGAGGMLGGYSNRWTNSNGNTIDRTDIVRYRQYFLGPCFSFGYLHPRSKILKALYWVSDHVRMPAPTLELRNSGKAVFHWLYW